MGSLNVMWALGLFDINGGCGRESGYFVNRPLFETVEIDLDSAYYEGKSINLCSEGGTLRLNGKVVEPSWISHRALVGGLVADRTIFKPASFSNNFAGGQKAGEHVPRSSWAATLLHPSPPIIGLGK